MKIIKDNYNKTTTIVCNHCGSILEISLSDVKTNICGNSIIECPLCYEDNYINVGDLV